MNPIFALWWFMHRSLIEPEIAAGLSKQQRKFVWKQASAQFSSRWSRGLPFWIGVLAGVALLVLLFGPLRWIFLWARQLAGPLGSVIVGSAFALGIGVMMWWISRRLVEKSVYQTLRSFEFDVCPLCGYWLRGLGDDVKHCPECGAERADASKADST